ncbi:hypothetical protein [Accumulibacter sp.]|uniref:hypothetical protein n=1 Tax=Accumulibacter sp. TaxID=2053492 RepID=UPI00260359B1|nr:hypothetical protein [Accumulibacter sp.]
MIRIAPPHWGHTRGNTSQIRAISRPGEAGCFSMRLIVRRGRPRRRGGEALRGCRRRQAVEQFHRCQYQADAAGAGLHTLVDQTLGVDLA